MYSISSTDVYVNEFSINAKIDGISAKRDAQEKIEKKSDVKFVKIKKQEIAEAKIEPVEKPVEIKKNEAVKKEIKETKPLVKNIEKKVERKKEVNFEEAKKLQDNLLKEQIVKNENSLQEKTLEKIIKIGKKNMDIAFYMGQNKVVQETARKDLSELVEMEILLVSKLSKKNVYNLNERF